MIKTMYKWHKWISLVMFIPILLWGLSSLLHPIRRLTKPTIATHILAPAPLDIRTLVFNPDEVMNRYGIEKVRNVRIIKMNGQHYYQFKLTASDVRYFNVVTAEELPRGEQRYAEYLAHQYLGDEHLVVSGIEFVEAFNDEYTAIKRFLPVWRVNFKRDDGLRLYIDTESARLAASVNDLRAELQWWFGVLHNWSYLDKGSLPRIVVFLLAMLAMFILSVTGIVLYGVWYKCLKKSVQRNKAYYHRTIGMLISLSMLMFSFSGGMHVWHKLTPDDRYLKMSENDFLGSDLSMPLKQAIEGVKPQDPVKEISLVMISNEPYFRFVHMKVNQAASYVHSQTGESLLEADVLYARQMASQLSGLKTTQISVVKPITQFSSEYGFMDRRMPVMQVKFNAEGNPAYYIDLATGKLAAMVNDSKRFEKFTFRMFHMWHFADVLSKNGRDVLIAIFILLNILVVLLGMSMYLSKRSRKMR